MKVPLRGMTNYQGNPTHATLTIEYLGRLEDGLGNAAPGALNFYADPQDLLDRQWRDDHTRSDIGQVVTSDSGVRPTVMRFTERFFYNDRPVDENTYMKLSSPTNLAGDEYDYTAPQKVELLGGAGLPLTFQAAADLIGAGGSVLVQVGDKLSELNGVLADIEQSRNEALAVTGIDPAYISETTADPPPAPDGTRGAKRDAAGNLTRLLRSGGAWGAVGTPIMALSGVQRRGHVSVLDFGAQGDNVTDSTAAFQVAIDLAVAQGRQIYIPAGVYRLNALTYAGPFTMRGEGNLNTVLKYIPATGTLFSATADCGILIGTSISDLWMQGPGQTVAGGAGGFLGRTNGSNRHITFNRVRVSLFNGVGIEVSDSFNLNWTDCYILNNGSKADGTGGGVKLNSVKWTDVSSTGNLFLNSYIAANEKGIFTDDNVAEQSLGLLAVKTIFENNTYGIFAARSSTQTLMSCYFEANGVAGVKASQLTAINCHAHPSTAATTDGFDVSGSLVEIGRKGVNYRYGNVNVQKMQLNDQVQGIEDMLVLSGGLRIGSYGNVRLYTNDANPEGVVTADRGSLCINRSTAKGEDVLWVKTTSGNNTGWMRATTIPLSGTTAQRPAPESVPKGTPYYDADLPRIVFSNGVSAWREYNGLTSVTGTTGGRPTPITGAMYYDTGIAAPLWGDTGRWRQAHGAVRWRTITSGQTTTLEAKRTHTHVTNVGTVAAHTFALPADANDGDRCVLSSSPEITALTLTVASGTVRNAPATLAAGSGLEFLFEAASNTWHRIR